MSTFDQKQTTLGYALLLYIVIVVVLITLIPFEFRVPDKIQLIWATYTEDFFANIIFGAVLGAVSQLLARVLKAGERAERRFELPTLKRLLPLYLIYLLLVAAWPTTVPLNEWQVFIDFQEFTSRERIVFIFRFVELIAAFTLLGYMIAQMRGRKNESGAKTLAWILLGALCASAITAVLKGPPPLIAATVFQTVGMTAACLYGAVIYRLQLAAIRGSNLQPQT